MPKDQLDGLVAFIAVAELQSFSSAAVRIGVSKSAISQSIHKLEQRLGVALFNRTTRSVSLTEPGAQFLERIGAPLRELISASEDIGMPDNEPSGLLRLNVSPIGFMIAIQPVLREFLEEFPNVNVEVYLENRVTDVVGAGFDAGIRFVDLVEKDMIAVKFGPPMFAYIVASPDYLAKWGTPQHPNDLLHHCCVGFRHITSGKIEPWHFARGDESLKLSVSGRLIINDPPGLIQATLDGLGIAYMVNGYIERFIDDGRLIRLLEEWSPPLPELSLYYPDRRRVPPKLRAFIDFVRKRTSAPRLYTTVG